ncbi:MAG: thioredoxin-disulfide reductase [Candidatus Aquicultorales bacterium]
MADRDLVILGGGPAGLAAGLYAARARLSTLLLERELIGGQMATTEFIENYPGFLDSSSGMELADKMREQAEKFGLKIELAEATEIHPQDGNTFLIKTPTSETTARSLILAMGRRPQNLDVPGEKELRGRGVSYCATCDGPFFRDKKLIVVGGGNAAIEEALYLTRFATEVTIVHRREALRADRVVQERAFQNDRIGFAWNARVAGITGDGKVESVLLEQVNTGERVELRADGVFVYVGSLPNTEAVEGLVDLDERGYIVVDSEMATSRPGVFAAGDVRVGVAKQVATAVGDGAAAAISAERYLQFA